MKILNLTSRLSDSQIKELFELSNPMGIYPYPTIESVVLNDPTIYSSGHGHKKVVIEGCVNNIDITFVKVISDMHLIDAWNDREGEEGFYFDSPEEIAFSIYSNVILEDVIVNHLEEE